MLGAFCEMLQADKSPFVNGSVFSFRKIKRLSSYAIYLSKPSQCGDKLQGLTLMALAPGSPANVQTRRIWILD